MTNQPPARFENYPPGDANQAEPPAPAEPAHSDAFTVTPYHPPQLRPPPPPGGMGRRGLLAVLVGVPVAALLFGVMASVDRSRSGSSEDPSDWASRSDEGSSSEDDPETDVTTGSAIAKVADGMVEQLSEGF